VLLEGGDLARNSRTRQTHLLGYSRKAAEFSDANEQMHGLKSIHCCSIWNKYLQIVPYLTSTEQSTVTPQEQD
jgi:hypothetical protein